MRTETLTDTRALEAALDEKWCHFIDAAGRRLCGLPRAQGDDPPDPHSHGNYTDFTRCGGCGRRKCPDCVAIWRGAR